MLDYFGDKYHNVETIIMTFWDSVLFTVLPGIQCRAGHSICLSE